ncbi:MAG: alpha/beta fold hydrolase [Roseovarius sp.]
MSDPIVFLPPMMCDARIFSAQLTAFSPTTPVTVAPVTGGDRVEEIASRLLDGLPRRFAVAGADMGGCVAMELLRRAPDRVSRVAFICTNALAETPQSAAEYEPLVIKLKAGQLEQAVHGFFKPVFLAPGVARARIIAEVVEMARNIGVEAIVAQIRAMQRRRDYQAALRRCKVPGLVISGEYDQLTPPRRHALMAELIPDAEHRVIEDAGHLPMLEQPEAMNAALRDWLARAPAKEQG